MSLAHQLEELGNLKDSGAITQAEFEHSKNRLLDECVRRIETFHDEKPGATARLEVPPVNVVQGTVQHLLFLPNGYSPQYAVSAASAAVGQPTAISSSSCRSSAANTQEIFQESKNLSGNGSGAGVEAPPDRKTPTVSTRLEPPPVKAVRSAVQHIRFLPPDANPPSTVREPVDRLAEASPSSAADPSPNTQQELPQSKSPLPQDGGRLFEAFYSPKPPASTRWGLPQVRVKIVRGVVQKISISERKPNDKYTASVEVDGQQAEIGATGSIGIEAGDHVALGGYERNGKLLALAYHNESTGDHPDLRRLRKGYVSLLVIGRISLGAGIGAIACAMILLLLQARAAGFDSGLWGYVPYALSILAAAAVSYLGLGLSFLGSRAKEFHDAMKPSSLSATPS